MSLPRHLLVLLLLGTSTSGCGIWHAPPPPRSQLEVRALQTRSYDAQNLHTVMKAVIDTLQDEGFLIVHADSTLGLISGARASRIESPREAFLATLLGGDHARYRHTHRLDASASITDYGARTRVRLVLQTRTFDNFGAPLDAHVVDDARIYRDFFTKIDKSLFITNANL
jgi:hypothetical protein